MMVWSLFDSGERPSSVTDKRALIYTSEGIHYAPGFDDNDELASFLAQLEDEGYIDSLNSGYLLSWGHLYRLLDTPAYETSVPLLGLPELAHWRPVLTSRGSLADPGFSVTVTGWIGPDAVPIRGEVAVSGAIIRVGTSEALLPGPAWDMLQAVADFNSRPAHERGPDSNRRAWAAIRTRAVTARADLSDFLRKTIVLTPETIRVGLRKGNDGLVEVIPEFDGAPPRWLEVFDRLGRVEESYAIPDGEGLTHVLPSPEVKTVLEEIKRMPGRRVTGERANAFVRNPYSVLGPDAEVVIDPQQFEQARDEAGIGFARFTAQVCRDDNGHPFEIALLIEETLGGEVRSERHIFEGETPLAQFLEKLDEQISRAAQCCHWNGYDLEILGETPQEAERLRLALADLRRLKSFDAAEIFDLSRYSDRIAHFGEEKPYYSPFIARKDEGDGWFPDNLEFALSYTPESGGETVAVVLNKKMLEAFKDELNKSKAAELDSFTFPGCPRPIGVAWAEEALKTFGQAQEDAGTDQLDKKAHERDRIGKRLGLVVKPNIETLDYSQSRGRLAPVKPHELPAPTMPSTLRPSITLKMHQHQGLAWLQRLWEASPNECRGALLADDMGLGKTLQLLAFMVAALEADPQMDPFLVVAPVSLLENWKEEIEKFFEPGTLSLLTLYGSELAAKRLSRNELDAQLTQSGVTRLLRRDWRGDAKVVLTTYETLRDLEFSLAMERWSVMVCDEAQKLKNPNAMVTRAAKKQNARFKIACTGTPVENTLADLWCLFDFVQPGLLGALKDFGQRYRRPIEAKTEEDKTRVAELKALIEPQTLRRTKAEVAKDLPRKLEDTRCRNLPLSGRQRTYYAESIHRFRQKTSDNIHSGLQSPLGLLQYLRRLCSDPRPPGTLGIENELISDLTEHSPKLAWLLQQLEAVRASDEKAIIFCEFRDLQRTLRRAIHERLGFSAQIINGDTSTASASAHNRQRCIRAFQDRPGFGVIILSPLAVGFGVNIQAANHVIHFTRTWNPAKEDQATDRAYRIGQTRDVYVYYPVVVADDFTTFDQKLDRLLDWKRSLSTDMLNGTGELSATDFGDIDAPGGGSAFGDDLITADHLATLDHSAFEALCAVLWSKRGYQALRTPQSGDGGVDVVAIKGVEGVLIQCKSSAIDGNELGWDAVKEVVAGAAAYAAKHPGVKFTLVAATNRQFNGNACWQARLNHVTLLTGADLAKQLTDYPVRFGELAAFLFSC